MSTLRKAMVLSALLLSTMVQAEDKIIIGQSVELSGQATGKENTIGAQLYFKSVNAQGGVNGKLIQLITYDDKRDPAKTKDNTLKLINEHHAIALFGYRSTPTVEAVLPLLEKYHIPLIAPFSGAQSLHQPMRPYLFNLRASYHEEAAKMVTSLLMLKMDKIAIFHQDDTFGKDGLDGFIHELSAHQIKPAVVAAYSRKELNVSPAVKAIAASAPQAIMMACTPAACIDFIKQYRRTGQRPQFVMLSNVNSESFTQSLGADGRGVGIMQVMPYPNDIGIGVARELQKAMKAEKEPVPVTYAVLEGFVAAKLLTEGLRKAGTNPTSQKLMAALESFHHLDLGGIPVSYGNNDRDGSHFTELTIVGKQGNLLR